MESYETCVDIGERFLVRCRSRRNRSCSCNYCGRNAGLGNEKQTIRSNTRNQTSKANQQTNEKNDENNNKDQKKETCCEWLKSLLGLGPKNVCLADQKGYEPKKKSKPGIASAPVSSKGPCGSAQSETLKKCLERKVKQEAYYPCDKAGNIYFSTTKNKGLGDHELNQEATSPQYKATEGSNPGGDTNQESPKFTPKSKESPSTSKSPASKSKSPASKSKSPASKSKKTSPRSKSPTPKSKSSTSKFKSPKQGSCRSFVSSDSRSSCDRVFKRAAKSQSTQSSNRKMCSPCRSPYVPSTRCSCLCPSPCRLRSLSLTCLRPRCSGCSPCVPNCTCVSCQPSTCASPRRCRVPKSQCCSPRCGRCRPRSCPRPSRCSCPLCCIKPCQPRKRICCPYLPSTLCNPCVPRPSCLSSCCTKCIPGSCGYTRTSLCSPYSTCPRVCRPSSCCKPLCSLGCSPLSCSTCPTCCLGTTSKYNRSKRGDALCNMLLSRYSKPCPSSSCYSRTPCGGCRICPLPDNVEGCMPVPGCNRTNSSQSVSPDRSCKKCTLICYTPVPNEKTPYKVVDLSTAIYTPCVRRTGIRSSVQHFHALKKAEDRSPSPKANLNNGAITDDADSEDLNNFRVRVEGHYERRCRVDQARALQQCDLFLNCLCPRENQSTCLLQQCRNNNFGDENFRFFRKYLNITPTPQIEPDEPVYYSETNDEEKNVSQNMVPTSDILAASKPEPNPERIEEQISRIDDWILSKDSEPVSPPPKPTKKKTVTKKKSTPTFGVPVSIYKKPHPKPVQRRVGSNLGRAPKQHTEGEVAARRLIMQPEFVRHRSPQKSGDQVSHYVESRTPTNLQSQPSKELGFAETTKILLPPEAKLSSPLKHSFSQMPSLERERYRPEFSPNERLCDKSPMSEDSSTASPRVLRASPTKSNNTSENVISFSRTKNDKGDSAIISAREFSMSAKSHQSRSNSRTKSPLRCRSSSPGRSPRGVHIPNNDLSPQLPPGESCVDAETKSRTPRLSPRAKSITSHSSPGARSITSHPSPGAKSLPSQRSPSAKSIKSQQSVVAEHPSPSSKSCTSQPNVSVKKTIFSTIASIWGAPPRKTVSTKEQSVVPVMSKEHILSGKESSVDLEREAKVHLDGSSNNECLYGSTIPHNSAIVELDENDEDLYESDIDFEINAHSSRESLVEVNKSHNRGGSDNEENLQNIPCCHSEVTADVMASPISTMTGTISINASPALSLVSCTDTCNSSIASSATAPTLTASEESTIDEPKPGPLTSKVASMNLQQLLASSSVMWQKIDEGDIDVASIRSTKEAYFKRLRQRRAEREKTESSEEQNQLTSGNPTPSSLLKPLEETIDDCTDSCSVGTLCTQ